MRCCRWWPRCSPATATWPSAPGWPPVPTWSAVPGASSSPAATTSSCVPRSGAACTDAQCGFKAMRREAAVELLPLVEDDEWFFDTEVLVTAQRLGLRIHEVPVDWVDDPDSRVEVVPHRLGRPPRRVAHARARRRGSGRHPARPGRPPAGTAPSLGYRTGPGARRSAAARRRPADRRCADRRRRSSPTNSSASPGSGRSARWPTPPCSPPSTPEWAATLANTVAIVACSLGNTAAHRGMAGTAGRGTRPGAPLRGGRRRWSA